MGLIGFGRIGSHLYTRLKGHPGIRVGFVYEVVRDKVRGLEVPLVEDPNEIAKMDADLVVEAADFRTVRELVPMVLAAHDALVLSASALADQRLYDELAMITRRTGHRLFIPHGAILGTDGLQDAREAIQEVDITTVKAPRNLDFGFQQKFRPEQIGERTVLYSGPTRGICGLFPRNVNSHAVIALAGIGFDRTRSELVADPAADKAMHEITIRTADSLTRILQSSAIKGVTGEYTLASVYGTVVRILSDHTGTYVM